MRAETFIMALRLDRARCLVVGSSDEVADRAERLARSGAEVRMVSARPTDRIRRAAGASAITLTERAFCDEDVDGCRLVVLVDRDAPLAQRLDARCRRDNVLFCAIDQPYGDFAHVATVRRGPISIGISTDGRLPALARRLRQELSRLFDSAALDALVADLEALRARTPSTDRAHTLGAAARRLSLPGALHVGPPPGDDEPNPS